LSLSVYYNIVLRQLKTIEKIKIICGTFFAGFIIISSAVRLRWDNPSMVVKKAFILYKKRTPPPVDDQTTGPWRDESQPTTEY